MKEKATEALASKIPKESVEEAVSKLLGFVDEKSIIRYDKDKGIIFIGGERADDNRLANLKSEAEFLLQSDLWKNILTGTVTHIAHETMFVKSTTFDDMKSGKMMLFNLSTIKNILTILSSYQKKVK